MILRSSPVQEMYDGEALALHNAASETRELMPHRNLWCFQDEEGDAEGDEEEEEPDIPWLTRMSASEKWRFQLARALLHNPHVLAIHRPVQELSGEVRQIVLACLKDFVRMRGLDVEGGLDAAKRRPRTVIFTTGSDDRFDFADYVWRITPQGVAVEKSLPPLQNKAPNNGRSVSLPG